MSHRRKLTITLPTGDYVLTQSSGKVRFKLNLDQVNPDTVEWLFHKGLELAIRNAYASEKTDEGRQEEGQRKATEICQNVRNAGRGSTFDEIELAMIRIYALKKYGGSLPQGGLFKAWKEISELPSANLDRLREVARVTVDTTI